MARFSGPFLLWSYLSIKIDTHVDVKNEMALFQKADAIVGV